MRTLLRFHRIAAFLALSLALAGCNPLSPLSPQQKTPDDLPSNSNGRGDDLPSNSNGQGYEGRHLDGAVVAGEISTGVTAQADGRALTAVVSLAGSAGSASIRTAVATGVPQGVRRFLDGGGADRTFGVEGFVTAGFAGKVFVQRDGRILASGPAYTAPCFAYGCVAPYRVRRFDAEGNTDPTFADAGWLDPRLTVTIGPDNPLFFVADNDSHLVLDRDERLVMLGDGGDGRYVRRFLSDGTPDTALAGTGSRLIDFRGSQHLAVRKDASFLVAGGYDYVLSSIRAFSFEGIVDAGFGNGGMLELGRSMTEPLMGAVGVDPDGDIVVVGMGRDLHRFVVLKFYADGRPKTSFGNNGTATIPVMPATNRLQLEIGADGRILVGASGVELRAGTPGKYSTIVARLMPDGRPDATFGKDGIAGAGLTYGYNEFLRGMRARDDGSVVVVSNVAPIPGPEHPDGHVSGFVVGFFGADGNLR